MRQHTIHRLPDGAFSAIIGARKQPRPEPTEGFQRHLVGQETPIECRFRVPLTSVPTPAPKPRPPTRGPRPKVS